MNGLAIALEPLMGSGATMPKSVLAGDDQAQNFRREWVPAGEQASAKTVRVASGEYRITAERVRELWDEDEYDESGAISRPTRYALSRTLELLKRVEAWLREDFPRGSASVAHDGGIRVTWTLGAREVRLVIGGQAGATAYIYSHPEDVLNLAVSAENLTDYLAELVDEI